MHAGLTESQRELRDSVRAVLLAECPPGVVRACYDDPERWRGLWKTVVDLGWTEMAEPSNDLGCVELVLVLEELGRVAAPIPFLSTVGLSAGALAATSQDASYEVAGHPASLLWLGSGDRCLEPTLAVEDGRVRGHAGEVADAPRAERFVALARAKGGHVLVTFAPGSVSIEQGQALDPSRPLATVSVDAVPDSMVAVSLHEALTVPLTAAAAELVGVAQRLLDLAVTYAKTREQFGQPIGSFQGIKHKLADTYVAVERARSLTYLAAMTVDASEGAWRHALLAKAVASETAMAAARACVQVHGAIAQTWEHDVHLFVRRAWQSAASMGDARVLYKEAARSCI